MNRTLTNDIARAIRDAALSLPVFLEHPEVKREFEYSLGKRTRMWEPAINEVLRLFDTEPSEDLYALCGAWFTLIHLSAPIDQIVDKDPMSAHWKELGITGGYLLVLRLKDEALALPLQGIAQETDPARIRMVSNATLALSSACITASVGSTLDIAGGMDLNSQTIRVSHKIALLYELLVSWKSSVIYETLFRVLAVYCKANAEQSDALAEFGKHVGYSIQMMDDTGGIWGQGDDLQKSPVKMTAPIAYALHAPGPAADELRQEIIAPPEERNISRIREILDELEALRFMELLIEERKERSRHALSVFGAANSAGLLSWYDAYFRRTL